MSVTRAQLGRSPAYITLGGVTFYTRQDFLPKHSPVWKPVNCTLHGQIDKYKSDFVIKHNFMLFGLWQSLSTLFPSYLMNPAVGTEMNGTSDTALAILAKNTDRITYPNAFVSKVTDLHLGVDDELFAGAVEVTCCLKNGANPEDAGAYFVRDTAAYSETAFSEANFKKTRWTGAWGALTGFGTIVAQKGWRISWAADARADVVDGLGTVGMYLGDGSVVGQARAIPIGPTAAQTDAQNQAVGAPMGVLLSGVSADLTLTGSAGGSVVLKNAGLTEDTSGFGIEPLRKNEVAWETTRLFAAGAASAVSVLS